MKPWLLLLAAPIPGVPGSRVPPRPRVPPRTPPPIQTSIALVVKAGAKETRTTVLPRQPAATTRTLAEVRASEVPQIRWMIRNEDKKTAVRSIVVHFLVTKVGALSEEVPSTPRKGSFADQVLGTDLRALGSTTGNFNTPIYTPGIYQVEVELLDAEGTRIQYAVLDLKVSEG